MAGAHPRVCGENPAAEIITAFGGGSSPRVRGKQTVRAAPFGVARLIPACAGKTTPRRKTPPALTAHPRVCGENNVRAREFSVVEGSSPRVRGKPPPLYDCVLSMRLIPACAGKTRAEAWHDVAFRAHPRVCGENALTKGLTSPAAGSSPRVRGKRLTGLLQVIQGGLIPACAGKTFTCKRAGG